MTKQTKDSLEESPGAHSCKRVDPPHYTENRDVQSRQWRPYNQQPGVTSRARYLLTSVEKKVCIHITIKIFGDEYILQWDP
jgi:hypothetical protein